MMKDFLHSKFAALSLGTAIIFLYPVLVFPKGEFELLINQFHYPALDVCFKYITHLGDGNLLAVLLIATLFYNYYSAILVAFSILFQAIIISIFKRGIFKGMDRPMAYFDESVSLNFVDGVDVHSANTFPSGHTATGFAIFALLFIIINNRGTVISSLMFVLAFLVGLSRVYLLQHFVIDAYFGAIFGILSVVLGLYFMKVLFKETKLDALKASSLRTSFGKSKKQ